MKRKRPSPWRQATVFAWVLILIFTGTAFRLRSVEETGEADWYVWVQLLTCGVLLVLGIVQLKWPYLRGWGTRCLMAYLLLVLGSAVFSPSPAEVAGYWLLLAGLGVATIALMHTANDPEAVLRLESIWLVTILLLIVKDAGTGLLGIQAAAGDGVQRLGMGVTHANRISFYATAAFCVSFGRNYGRATWAIWLTRVGLVAVILLSRTRMALIALFLGCLLTVWFSQPFRRRHGLALRGLLASLLVCAVMFAVAAEAGQLPGAGTVWGAFNRGQSIADMTSLSGRTEVWRIAVDRITDGPTNMVFGHGYGVSRLIINDGWDTPLWYAFHAHNAGLESLLSVGLAGSAALFLFTAYGALWLLRRGQLQLIYTPGMTTRAIATISVILVFSLTEAHIARKIDPIHALFFLYILALDQRHRFWRSRTPPGEAEAAGAEPWPTPPRSLARRRSAHEAVVR